MEMIAREAKVAVGTIYLHFASRDEVYLNLRADRSERLGAGYREVKSRGLAPLEEIRTLAQVYIEYLNESADPILISEPTPYFEIRKRLRRSSEIRAFDRGSKISHEVFRLFEGSVTRAFATGLMADSLGPDRGNRRNLVDSQRRIHGDARSRVSGAYYRPRAGGIHREGARFISARFGRSGAANEGRNRAAGQWPRTRNFGKRNEPMKTIWFHMQGYRDLPDDFRDRYESIWVTPPNDELCDPPEVAKYLHWNLDELEMADDLGFDGLGLNEHHQNGYGFPISPNMIATVLARRKSDAALVVLGNTLPLYNPPIRVAEEFALLDCLSGGRLGRRAFRSARRWTPSAATASHRPQVRPRYYEAHDLIKQAWTRPGPFAFNGRFTKLRYVNPWPKPLQKPHPPIWLRRRRLGRDLEVRDRQRLHLQLPELHRPQVRQGADGRLLGLGREGRAWTTIRTARDSRSWWSSPTPTPKRSEST